MGIRRQNSVAAVGLGEGLKWIPKLRLKQVLGMDHQFLFVTCAPFLTINLASFTFRTAALENIVCQSTIWVPETSGCELYSSDVFSNSWV